MKYKNDMKCFVCKEGTIIEPESYEGIENFGRCDSCRATFPHPRDRCSLCGGHYKYDCKC